MGSSGAAVGAVSAIEAGMEALDPAPLPPAVGLDLLRLNMREKTPMRAGLAAACCAGGAACSAAAGWTVIGMAIGTDIASPTGDSGMPIGTEPFEALEKSDLEKEKEEEGVGACKTYLCNQDCVPECVKRKFAGTASPVPRCEEDEGGLCIEVYN